MTSCEPRQPSRRFPSKRTEWVLLVVPLAALVLLAWQPEMALMVLAGLPAFIGYIGYGKTGFIAGSAIGFVICVMMLLPAVQLPR